MGRKQRVPRNHGHPLLSLQVSPPSLPNRQEIMGVPIFERNEDSHLFAVLKTKPNQDMQIRKETVGVLD